MHFQDKFVYKYDQSYHNKGDNFSKTADSTATDNSGIAELDIEGSLRKRVNISSYEPRCEKTCLRGF